MKSYLGKLIDCPAHRWVARGFGALCGAAWIFLFVVDANYSVLEFAEKVPVLPYVACAVGLFLLQTLLSPLLKCLDAWYIAIVVTGYAVTMMYYYNTVYVWLPTAAVVAAVFYYLFHDDKLELLKRKLPAWGACMIAGAAALLYIGYVGTISVIRYEGYIASTFDFGIFEQMFYYMRTTGLPLTTCERETLLSHFAVHFSPIYYVLLPGYMLFPSPWYLQIAQTVVLASGIIPLFLLTKHLGHGNRTAALLCVIYCLYPALTGGCSYDIHENCFLAPLLLWLFYSLEKNSAVGIYISAILTLFVKEDASAYVACVGIFAFCYLKRRLHGSILFGLSVTYFITVFTLLALYGDGSFFLSSRFGNFLTSGDQSFLQIIKVILLNPAYMFTQVLHEEKLIFVLQLLVPLAFVPVAGKKLGRLILLAPVLLLNLLPNYVYQYSINFQYIFGATAVLFYLAVGNLRQFTEKVRRTVLPIMLGATLVVLCATQNYTVGYLEMSPEKWAQCEKLDAAMELIPDEASVRTTGYFAPHLAHRRELYNYTTNITTDYLVLDLRPGHENITDSLLDIYRMIGYEDVLYEEDLIIIMQYTGDREA